MRRLWLTAGHLLGFAAVLTSIVWSTEHRPGAIRFESLFFAALGLTAFLHLIGLEVFFDPKANGVADTSLAGRGSILKLFRTGLLFGAGGAVCTAATVWLCDHLFGGYYWFVLLVPILALLAAVTWAVEPEAESATDGGTHTTNGYPRFRG